MKYIVMQATISSELAREDIIIFPDELVHLEMSEIMKHNYSMSYSCPSKIVSAGFVNTMTLECFGESESTGIKSRGDIDTALIMAGKYGANLVNI